MRASEALRGDLNASREALGETLNAAQEDFEHHSGLVALQRLQSRVEQVRFEASEALERARLSTRNSGEALGAWVQERPVEVLVVAFGIGLIFGARPFK